VTAPSPMKIWLSPPTGEVQQVFVFVKVTWRIGPRGLERDASAPIDPGFLDGPPSLLPGTDAWPVKYGTDVVVLGAAFARGGRPVRSRMVSVKVGEREVRVEALGPRSVRWRDGETPELPEPEPFTRVELSYRHSYGGIDGRVPIAEEDHGRAELDHPGAYPRNPFGNGYIVLPDEPDRDVALPQLEDPDDRLTAERFLVRDPALWYLQPRPASLGWVHPVMFPRSVWFDLGADAWFPAPDDHRLAEVRDDELPAHWRRVLGELSAGPLSPHPWFAQEASRGLRLDPPEAGTPVTLVGLHPEFDTLGFALPAAPRITVDIEGERAVLAPRLHHVVCEPEALQVRCTYAVNRPLPRRFIPGIHKHIPIAAQVDDGDWIAYETPTTVLDALKAGGLDPLAFVRGA
jgi:hypothetical protein